MENLDGNLSLVRKINNKDINKIATTLRWKRLTALSNKQKIYQLLTNSIENTNKFILRYKEFHNKTKQIRKYYIKEISMKRNAKKRKYYQILKIIIALCYCYHMITQFL